MTTTLVRAPVGDVLRTWREKRRLSQLGLAARADISARHLSFLETGRSAPSREMVLRLAEQLEMPLRERNELLLSAGYAPMYSHIPLDAPQMSAVRNAITQVVAGHDPYPAMAVDRKWNLAASNQAFSIFTESVSPHLLEPPINVLRLTLHPDGLAPRLLNHGEWRGYLLHRLRIRISRTNEPWLARLHEELAAYPCADRTPDFASIDAGAGIVLPMRLRIGDVALSMFSTVAFFGTPLDVTVSELLVKSFFPMDEQTTSFLISRRAKAGAAGQDPAEMKH